MTATGIVRITDTFKCTLKIFDFPKTTTEDYLQHKAGDTIKRMKYPPKTPPSLFYGNA